MTTRHLKIFLNVYITGSMPAAAQKLYMTQPSVSQAIRELEEHYGVPLFERLYRKLYPTQAGKQLFLYAEKFLGMFDDMEATMQADALPQLLGQLLAAPFHLQRQIPRPSRQHRRRPVHGG